MIIVVIIIVISIIIIIIIVIIIIILIRKIKRNDNHHSGLRRRGAMARRRRGGHGSLHVPAQEDGRRGQEEEDSQAPFICFYFVLVLVAYLLPLFFVAFEDSQAPVTTPSLPTKIIPAKIRWLNISGKFPVDMRVPPLEIKILLESKPLKFRILVRRLAVPPLSKRRHADFHSTASFQSSIWKNGPSPWEIWTSKGHFEVKISNVSGLGFWDLRPSIWNCANRNYEHWPR